MCCCSHSVSAAVDAVAALPAGIAEPRDRDAFADVRPVRHAGAELLDDADPLVAGDERRPAGLHRPVAVSGVDVGVAQTARLHADEDLPGAGAKVLADRRDSPAAWSNATTTAAFHSAAEAFTDQPRQVTRVVQVGVGEDNGVERRGVGPEGLPVAPPQVGGALVEARIDQETGVASLDQEPAPGHTPRRSEEAEDRLTAHGRSTVQSGQAVLELQHATRRRRARCRG